MNSKRVVITLASYVVMLASLVCIASAQAAVAVSQQPSGKDVSGVVTLDVANAPLDAVLRDVAAQANLLLVYMSGQQRLTQPVSIRAERMPVKSVIQRLAKVSGVGLTISPDGKSLIVVKERAVASKPTGQGVIAGQVTDSKTGKGISGATISISKDSRGSTAGEDGSYRLTAVPVGAHTILVRFLGYAKQSRSVTVGEGATVTVDFKLEASANVLDQIVVTGTVVQTELKAIPNAITVITAKQIEERGITRIDQLFRGDIPGLFAANGTSPMDKTFMFSRGATALSFSSVGTSFGTNPIKTYVDGVELADASTLTQIDPKSIERIEVLAGPQASTIYGSNALNGVMQIFTKRGTTSRPQLSLNLLSGWVQNNFRSALTPQHDYNAQLSAIEGRISYNVGASWQHIGAWTPAKQTSDRGVFGGARLETSTLLGPITADVTFRSTTKRTRELGNSVRRTTSYQETGWYSSNFIGIGVFRPNNIELAERTFGLALVYVPAHWWSHEVGVGRDRSDLESRSLGRAYSTTSDTVLNLTQAGSERRSLRYTTTARVPVTSAVNATITLGVDGWQSLGSTVQLSPQSLTGTLAGATVARQPDHNTGGFVQGMVGIQEQLFVTYGIRAEWNPNYGAEAQPNVAPRYGIAYTKDIGLVTAKMRASYGRSTRPPRRAYKNSISLAQSCEICVDYWGNVPSYFANPDLGPEFQGGSEGGLELYIGNKGSLVVTRYNQTVDNLIADPAIDSVNLVPDMLVLIGEDVYQLQRQYVNLGSIRNQGWELQGSINTGPLTTRGTYSWTKSRTLGVSPKYRTQFASNPQYQPGATFQYLPEHTWALGTTYTRSRSRVTLSVSGIGQLTNSSDELFGRSLSSSIRLIENRQRLSTIGYVNLNKGYAQVNATAAQQFSKSIEGIVQVYNLTDVYENDLRADYSTIGRQVKTGFRVRM